MHSCMRPRTNAFLSVPRLCVHARQYVPIKGRYHLRHVNSHVTDFGVFLLTNLSFRVFTDVTSKSTHLTSTLPWGEVYGKVSRHIGNSIKQVGGCSPTKSTVLVLNPVSKVSFHASFCQF